MNGVRTRSPGLRPQHQAAVDHVQLQRVDVLLVLLVAASRKGSTRSSRTSSQNAEAYCRQIQCE